MGFNYKLRLKAFLLLLLAKAVRMFSYGMLSFVFLDNLFLKGFSPKKASLVQFAAVLGDLLISLYLSAKADKLGRLNVLMAASILKIVAGLCFADSQSTSIIILSGFLGIISVTGREMGPFQIVERAALSKLVQDCTSNQNLQASSRGIFKYYNLVGYIGQGMGAAFAGFFVHYVVFTMNCTLQAASVRIIRIYAILGGIKLLLYSLINREEIEGKTLHQNSISFTGLKEENLKPTLLLGLVYLVDAFTGVFAAESFLSYYLQMRLELNFRAVGMTLLGCCLLSGVSTYCCSPIIQRYGPRKTVIYSVLYSGLCLFLVAAIQHPLLCAILLLCRYFTLQIYAPARHELTYSTVPAEQRATVNGITGVAFRIGLLLGMALNGIHIIRYTYSTVTVSFIVSGLLNILVVYYYFGKYLPSQERSKFQSIESQQGQNLKGSQFG